MRAAISRPAGQRNPPRKIRRRQGRSQSHFRAGARASTRSKTSRTHLSGSLDVTLQPGGTLEQELPEGWNAFSYVLNGAVTFNEPTDSTADATETLLPRYHFGVFTNNASQTHVRASVPEGSHESSRFILVAGQPLDQPIVQYGPFVTTSRAEIMQAMTDFQTHSNGFERADRWESGIGKRMGRV